MNKRKVTLEDVATQLKAEDAPRSLFDDQVEIVKTYTASGMNVLLIGRHGTGKTAIISKACKDLGLKMAYWSAPLADPEIDLGGVPVPNKVTGTLDFFANPIIHEAEVVFLDELNRASPRMLNMVFELIQFKSIHGKRLPKLKAVHSAINPPGAGAYDVQALDDALLDRFHAYLNVEPQFPKAIIVPIIGEAKADAMAAWYAKLDKSKYVAPRRLEYAAQLHAIGMPLTHAFLDGSLPVGALEGALARAELGNSGIESAAPPQSEPWNEPEFQAILANPDLTDLNEAFTQYLAEQGITSDMLWEKIKEIRSMGGIK